METYKILDNNRKCHIFGYLVENEYDNDSDFELSPNKNAYAGSELTDIISNWIIDNWKDNKNVEIKIGDEDISNKDCDYIHEQFDVYLNALTIYVKKCNLYLYITEEECSLEEAQSKLLYKLDGYDSVLNLQNQLIGWSEFTIIGLNVYDFTIGNHDLKFLKQYSGKYINMVIEIKE